MKRTYREDLTGRQFGNLTVISLADRRHGKNDRRVWKCLCSCGRELEVIGTNLKRGNSTSCGCKFLLSKKYNFADLTGLRFSSLVVVRRCEELTKTRGALWECLCDCGKTVKLSSNALTTENNRTCGNLKEHPRSEPVGEIPLFYLTAVRSGASARKLAFELSPDYLWKLFLDQNRACALSGITLVFTPHRGHDFTASLDRIDNSLGYLPGNVRWVHKDVNRIRWNLSDDEFLEWCRRCFLHSFRDAPRPTVHEHFLMQAFDVSLRSEDIHTRHGAIVVENATQHQIGSGCNGFFRKAAVDASMLQRPEKYSWMIHAEENAIMNCTKNPLSLSGGATIYVTGEPCNACLQRIINFGIKQVYFAKRRGTLLEDAETRARQQKILKLSGVDMIGIDLDNCWLKRVYLDSSSEPEEDVAND